MKTDQITDDEKTPVPPLTSDDLLCFEDQPRPNNDFIEAILHDITSRMGVPEEMLIPTPPHVAARKVVQDMHQRLARKFLA